MGGELLDFMGKAGLAAVVTVALLVLGFVGFDRGWW